MTRDIKVRNILLLTATITPKSGVPNLQRIDPRQRLRDYEKAFSFYLLLLNQYCDAIIFAENSNSDVSSLKKLAIDKGLSDQVEFLVFDGLDYPSHYDRGYGEFKLVDYAMANSQVLIEQDKRSVIWKITGRYIVKNIHQIISCQPQNFDVYCNCRNFPKHWVDMFLIAWTPEAYKACLQNVYDRLKTNVPEVPYGTASEELLRTWFEQQPQSIRFKSRFSTTPEVEGIRGGDNTGYSTDNRWKFYLRNSLNWLMPWLWI